MAPVTQPRGRQHEPAFLKVNRRTPTLGKFEPLCTLTMLGARKFRLLVTTGSALSPLLSAPKNPRLGFRAYALHDELGEENGIL